MIETRRLPCPARAQLVDAINGSEWLGNERGRCFATSSQFFFCDNKHGHLRGSLPRRHTWHADLTAVPIPGGFWTNWIPNAIWQRWPVLLVGLERDRSFFAAMYGSRGVQVPAHIRRSHHGLGRIMSSEKVRPKHLIVDQGPEFKCEHFENGWCKAKDILPRYGGQAREHRRRRAIPQNAERDSAADHDPRRSH